MQPQWSRPPIQEIVTGFSPHNCTQSLVIDVVPVTKVVPGMFIAFIKTEKLSCSLEGSRTGVGDPVRSLYDFITCVFLCFLERAD